MKILAIETSCDETAISIVEGSGDLNQPEFEVLAHLISSQIDLHAKWGGVVPSLAKREHAKNIVPLIDQALSDSLLKHTGTTKLSDEVKAQITEIFTHEEGLAETFINFAEQITSPDIDAIAVTYGPGLEPALWVGINVTRALHLVWNKPVIPINHMEGHIVSVLLEKDRNNPNPPAGGPNSKEPTIAFPALALLVSGGHTELVKITNWFEYELIGQTRDDAVGEAFDKVARLLDLPYPGGPKIAELATQGHAGIEPLPRPMLHTPDYDFSFSGLKTAVLYRVKDRGLTNQDKADLAREFQSAITEVLVRKTFKAVEDFGIQTLIIGGGVIANDEIRRQVLAQAHEFGPELRVLLPDSSVTTDNATMIAMAGYLRLINNHLPTIELKALGNAQLG